MIDELDAALANLARVPRLLVASDYDGVLAQIVADPAKAFPQPGAVAVLTGLAGLPETTVAVVSGRARASLAAVSGLPEPVLLVGSHGAELADGVPLDPAQVALRSRLAATLQEITRDRPGVRVEGKPASVVLHTRTADRDIAAAAAAAVWAGPAAWPGVRALDGKEVVELSVVEAHKGTAVHALRVRSAADAVLFLGDDVTDENAFAVLGTGDVGIKVGSGETAAQFRVPDPPAALRALTLLRDLRAATPTTGPPRGP